ncbi:MAG: peroxide stress protein YaaA [Lutibacter sp.]|uniref:peroxide stress protein YaaA n=1 Tax=Lutibacter sp. TaxID=1925666 RepID=UPI0017ECB830|nr:peroxide stress protein YaaA [Lutibacter sp.]MBT8317493.1 peroxide stress protein YaaA [Lutibacter sp.]NNJ58352.1 peroxide stress protein YaaA [Lutibacter sp.]
MKIVISPAKSLDFETQAPISKFTQGIFLNEADKLSAVLKKKSPKKLSDLMSISEKLGELNWQRNQDWQLPFTLENAKQAVFAFKGDVYIGLDAYSLSEDKIEQLQQKLRILSGQYGLLKPLDLMQPYRLEMGTKLKVGKKENLYQFWDESITNVLNRELNNNEVFVNLASNEYFKVIQPKLLKVPVITPVFKDYKNGKLKIISFFAKKARGLMVRYIIDNNIENVEDLKGFNYEGYAFDQNLSNAKELVFTR